MALRTQNLVAILASECGLDFDEVALKTRRLREAGLFTRETRSPKSPHPTPEDAVRLMAMILTEAPAILAAETIGRLSTLTCQPCSHWQGLHDGRITLPPELAVFRQPDHTFLEAMTALVTFAVAQPRVFRQGEGAFQNSGIQYDRGDREGAIAIDYRPDLPLVECAADARPWRVDLDYQRPDSTTGSTPLKLSRVNAIGAELLASLGEAFQRGTL